jgi:hypothetical protein
MAALPTVAYRYGLASYYEVLEAQQQLFPAQNTLAQIRRDRLLTHVRLYKALGGGWSVTDAEWAGRDEAGEPRRSMMNWGSVECVMTMSRTGGEPCTRRPKPDEEEGLSS